ncbi:MAG: DUF3078 domain-containing protein [Parabacteroides sp.]|nr:DUF3078 domain-containing protein [Parabacteroides sp.]
MVRRGTILFGLILVCAFTGTRYVYSQEAGLFPKNVLAQPETGAGADTAIQQPVRLTPADLDKINDLKTQFEKQNTTYSTPYQPNTQLLRFLKKDELELSDEALYWINKVNTGYERLNSLTFQDTAIVNPLFLPLIFKGEFIPENTTFYDFPWRNPKTAYSDLYRPDTSLFADVIKKERFEDEVYKYMEKNHPEQFRYSMWNVPKDIPEPEEIKTNLFADLFKVESEADFSDVSAPKKFQPKIRYWRPYFKSSIQFSQNYISENWYKGGNGNLNLFTRNYIKYDYNKDKIQFTNELEWKASFYTAPKDTVHDYRIGDDVFRIHSNLGYKAFSKWFYTLDAEFKTQFFTNFAENSNKKLAAFFSPYSINLGLGMKYELKKEFKPKTKNIAFSVNLAPFSYTYMHSMKKDIDLARHGFEDGRTSLSKIGSTVRADLTFNFNHFLSWQSRLYYFTSYDRIEGEFENTLNMAISRFFSTRIYLDLRYDDGVEKKKASDNYLQVYELLSFGFNYKW